MAAEEGQVISCHSDEHFYGHVNRGKECNKLVVIDFTAQWCGPCRMIAPILAEYAKKHPHVIFLKVDVDELKAVTEKYNVEAMPTFIFIKDGEVIDKVVGARKEELLSAIVKHSSNPPSIASAASSDAAAQPADSKDPVAA